MKYLKLVINNEKKKKDIFFSKIELKLILNLYAGMVSKIGRASCRERV